MNCRNITDGISLIKFCENLNDLNEFSIEFIHGNEIESEIDEEVLTTMEERQDQVVEKKPVRLNQMLSYVLFMIKLEAVNNTGMSPQEAIKNALKKNSTTLNLWHVTIIYVKIR